LCQRDKLIGGDNPADGVMPANQCVFRYSPISFTVIRRTGDDGLPRCPATWCSSQPVISLA
ncbi:hypothetical protein MZH07_24415, partial [Escherichia coli]|nr:hypothetical protein [Escherichia coli]